MTALESIHPFCYTSMVGSGLFFSSDGPELGSLSLLELLQCHLPELSYGYGFEDVSKELHQDMVPARVGIWDGLPDEVRFFEETVVRPLSIKLKRSYGMVDDGHEVNSRIRVGSLFGEILQNAPDIGNSPAPLPWGFPDACFSSSAGPLLVGLVEADYSFSELLTARKFLCAIGEESGHDEGVTLMRQLLLRLYSYMKLNSLAYGFITTWQNTWFVWVEQDLLAISEPVSRTRQPLMSLWYILYQALQSSSKASVRSISTQAGSLGFFIRSMETPVEFISALVQDHLIRASAEWKVSMETEVLSQVQVWRDSFRSLEMLAWKSGQRLGGSPNFNHSLFRVTYKGQDAVLKVTDLSVGELEWQEAGVSGFAREVQAYKMLRSLQGRVIPRLLAHGVVNGTMLAFVIVSYEGRCAMDRIRSLDMVAALDSLHSLGVGLGKVRADNVLVSSDGKLRIVGFSNAFFFRPGNLDTLELGRISQERRIVIPSIDIESL